MPWLRRFVLALMTAAALPVLAAGPEIVVTFPRPESERDQRTRHPMRLLEVALKRVNPNYRVQLFPVRMRQGRALILLNNSGGIDVVSAMTSTEREARLLPIRIPIDKGLIGWRLLLLNQERAYRFTGITNLDDLRRLKSGQGADWPDMAILRANDFNVYGSSSYQSLFMMLENQRIDYFPRSVGEIWAEVDSHSGLAVEPSIVLRYPTALYFFVRIGDKQLAADLTAGLEMMIADGSFEAMFQAHYGPLIRRAKLKSRRIFDLRNPVQPPSLPLDRKNLWFQQ